MSVTWLRRAGACKGETPGNRFRLGADVTEVLRGNPASAFEVSDFLGKNFDGTFFSARNPLREDGQFFELSEVFRTFEAKQNFAVFAFPPKRRSVGYI